MLDWLLGEGFDLFDGGRVVDGVDGVGFPVIDLFELARAFV